MIYSLSDAERRQRAAIDLEAAVELAEAEDAIRRAMGALPKRSVEVLRRRFGLDGAEPKTLKEVGALFGVGKEQIRRIQNAALAKLRHEIVQAGTSLERILSDGGSLL